MFSYHHLEAGRILGRNKSVLAKPTNSIMWPYVATYWIQPSITLGLVRRRRHMRTLHHALPALKVFKPSNGKTRNYLTAVKDIVLAAVYLLDVLMTLRKVLMLVGYTLIFIWHPMNLAFIIVKWCVVGRTFSATRVQKPVQIRKSRHSINLLDPFILLKSFYELCPSRRNDITPLDGV